MQEEGAAEKGERERAWLGSGQTDATSTGCAQVVLETNLPVPSDI